MLGGRSSEPTSSGGPLAERAEHRLRPDPGLLRGTVRDPGHLADEAGQVFEPVRQVDRVVVVQVGRYGRQQPLPLRLRQCPGQDVTVASAACLAPLKSRPARRATSDTRSR
jgi:hypothetical protein